MGYMLHHFLSVWPGPFFTSVPVCGAKRFIAILTSCFKYCLLIWSPILFKTIQRGENSLYTAKNIHFREHFAPRVPGQVAENGSWSLSSMPTPQLYTMTLRKMHAASPEVYRMFEDTSSHWKHWRILCVFICMYAQIPLYSSIDWCLEQVAFNMTLGFYFNITYPTHSKELRKVLTYILGEKQETETSQMSKVCY